MISTASPMQHIQFFLMVDDVAPVRRIHGYPRMVSSVDVVVQLRISLLKLCHMPLDNVRLGLLSKPTVESGPY